MKLHHLFAVAASATLLFATVGCGPSHKADGSNDPSMIGDGSGSGFGTLSSVTDENGAKLTGSRFEDLYKKVEGPEFSPVYFGFDSYSLPATELSKVQAVADHLKQNSNHVLVIEGNTDERGSNEYNLSLGENRALSIRTELIMRGITEDRIQTRSFGEEKPAVQGTGEEVWRLNRRGEFAIYQK